ncbi:hypothetical protein [Tenacibaculum xiamenense]|uniref:hypothetical protein n=1 Tax=Tenacibaculum xiamenense TaxID=1261553 RepID=UPI00389550EC
MKKMIALIMLSIMIISCKEEEITNPENQNDLSVLKSNESNMLRFGSVDELKEFISVQHENDEDLLDKARRMSEEGKYNPLLLVYNLEGKEAEKLGIKERNVPTVASNDDMLLLLLNENGEIGIEDKIFRIDGDFVYSYSEGTSSNISEFLNAYNTGEIRIGRGDTYEFSKELTVYRHNNDSEREENREGVRGATSYKYFSNNYRMKARQYNGYWLFYSSIGAKTKVEERKKFLWWSWWKTVKTDNRLEYQLTYNVTSTFGFPPLTLTASGHKYCHCNSANKVYDWSVGFPAAPNVYKPLEGYSKHWAHWYSTNPNTVSTTMYY